MRIICDSREQAPWELVHLLTDGEVIRKKLDVGDYSIEGYEREIAIERKSAQDFINTLTGDHERFSKEIHRAKEYRYFAMIVEASHGEVLASSRGNGGTALKVAYTLMIKKKLNVFFAKDRTEAARLAIELLGAYVRLREAEEASTKRLFKIITKTAQQ